MPTDADLLAIARDAITASTRGLDYDAPASEAPSQGVFVTLWAPNRELRGCIGHLVATEPNLAEEIATCAVSSALEDPRFPPVMPEEVPHLAVEISLLEPSEPARVPEDLDPHEFGVIVSNGYRRGVLLPDIEGVDDADTQLRVVLRKAGIRPGEPFTAERFRVRKIAEHP